MVLGDELDGYVVIQNLNAGIFPYSLEEFVLHDHPGTVLGMDDSILGMSALSSQIIGVALFLPTGKNDTPPLQLSDAHRTVPDYEIDSLGIAQANPSIKGILNMKIEGVVRPKDGGDAPLGIICVGSDALLLGENGYRSDVGSTQGKGKTCYPATHYEKI